MALVRLWWPSCELLSGQDAFFLEMDDPQQAARLTGIPALHPLHCQQQALRPDLPLCLLAARDGQQVEVLPFIFPWGGQHHGDSPLLAMQPVTVQDLAELHTLQPVAAPWFWPDELRA